MSTTCPAEGARRPLVDGRRDRSVTVVCALPAGHHDASDHQDDTGHTWPEHLPTAAKALLAAEGYTPDPDCACDAKCHWCAWMSCETCCDSYAADHGARDAAS